ncbi:methyltransferase domain-containing protein [Pseudoscourfieldia marina]
MAAHPPPPSTLLRLFLCEFSNRPALAESSHSYLKRKREPGDGDDEHEPSSGGLLHGQHSQDTPGPPLQDARTLQGQQGQGARSSFRTFEDARTYVRTLGLKSWKEWEAWSKSGKRPHDIPSNPNVTYASSGWTSHGDFLGYAVGKVAGSFRTFEDARTYVRTLGLKSAKEWEAWSKSGARPHDIPSAPYVTYASSGWTSYGDFLGFAVGKPARKTKESKFRSFEDARAYVHTLGLNSRPEWEAWSKSGARPHDIPSNPNVTYKSSGWTSYGDFLGYADGKVTGSFRSFEDARSYVRTLGLKSKEAWNAWRKSGARPHDIPSAPDVTYASSGWISYPDFLGYADGKVAGSYRNFEDARAYVRTLGLKSWKEWNAWSKSGARPHDIPSAPDVTYASSGWTSYGDFLGFADGQGARGSFRSFEDARTYVRTLGLKSWNDWQAWSKAGARPHDIPSNPNVTYKSSGWTSYGDFLGYAVGQGARGSYRTFEDARAYVRTLGLKSAKEWQAWSKSGARPPDIPSAPYVTYALSGWTSYGDFLGYAVGKSAVSTGSACIELIALPRSLKREPDDITPPQISQRFIVFDTPMLEMRYAAMYVAQMLREDGSKDVNDGDIELRLLSGDVVSLSEQTIRDVIALSASGTSASASASVHYSYRKGKDSCAVKEE